MTPVYTHAYLRVHTHVSTLRPGSIYARARGYTHVYTHGHTRVYTHVSTHDLYAGTVIVD